MMTVMLLMSVLFAKAQLEPNPELGAMIDHQRTIYTYSIARVASQEARELVQRDLKSNMINFQNIDRALDKAQKAFSIIDLLINSGVTYIKIKNTVNDVKDTYSGTKKLIDSYMNRCLLRKNIKEGDTIFISSCKNMIDIVYGGVGDITDLLGITDHGGLIELVGFVGAGSLSCSTDEMLYILDEISACCTKISKDLKKEYYRLWQYMQLRIGYWKDLPDPRSETKEICRNSIERWLRSAGSDKKVDY